jgi:hypothetical protein
MTSSRFVPENPAARFYRYLRLPGSNLTFRLRREEINFCWREGDEPSLATPASVARGPCLRRHALRSVLTSTLVGRHWAISAAISLQRVGFYFLNWAGLVMKYSSRSLSFVSMSLAIPLSLWPAVIEARDSNAATLMLAQAQSSKGQRVNVCRARYRDCRSRKEIPTFECKAIYQDCTHSII